METVDFFPNRLCGPCRVILFHDFFFFSLLGLCLIKSLERRANIKFIEKIKPSLERSVRYLSCIEKTAEIFAALSQNGFGVWFEKAERLYV
jgi:hypothetical protein